MSLLKPSICYKLGLCKYHVSIENMRKNEKWGSAIIKLFEEGHFTANIDSVFTIDQLDEHMKKLAVGGSKGKLVCSFE